MKVNVGLQYILYNTLYQLSIIVYFKIIIFYYVSTKYQSIELFDEDYHTLRHTLIFDMYTLHSDTNIFDMYTLYSDILYTHWNIAVVYSVFVMSSSS